jgi:hypothetical protein
VCYTPSSNPYKTPWIVQNIYWRMARWLVSNTLEGVWSNLRCYPRVCLEEMRKATGSLAEIWEEYDQECCHPVATWGTTIMKLWFANIQSTKKSLCLWCRWFLSVQLKTHYWGGVTVWDSQPDVAVWGKSRGKLIIVAEVSSENWRCPGVLTSISNVVNPKAAKSSFDEHMCTI